MSLFRIIPVTGYSEFMNIQFTKEGLEEYGPLFTCEPLVEVGDAISKNTKLFCIEGMNMLKCLVSPFKQGEVVSTFVNHSNCPSVIDETTPLITIKTGDTNAMFSV